MQSNSSFFLYCDSKFKLNVNFQSVVIIIICLNLTIELHYSTKEGTWRHCSKQNRNQVEALKQTMLLAGKKNVCFRTLSIQSNSGPTFLPEANQIIHTDIFKRPLLCFQPSFWNVICTIFL